MYKVLEVTREKLRRAAAAEVLHTADGEPARDPGQPDITPPWMLPAKTLLRPLTE